MLLIINISRNASSRLNNILHCFDVPPNLSRELSRLQMFTSAAHLTQYSNVNILNPKYLESGVPTTYPRAH